MYGSLCLLNIHVCIIYFLTLQRFNYIHKVIKVWLKLDQSRLNKIRVACSTSWNIKRNNFRIFVNLCYSIYERQSFITNICGYGACFYIICCRSVPNSCRDMLWGIMTLPSLSITNHLFNSTFCHWRRKGNVQTKCTILNTFLIGKVDLQNIIL